MISNIKKLDCKNNLVFFFKIFALSIITNLITGIVYHHYSIELVNPVTKFNKFVLWISALFFAPILETLLYQVLIYYMIFFILKKYSLKTKSIVYLCLASLLFAASHNYSVWYIIATILPGLLLTYVFLHLQLQYSNFKISFFYTCLFHFLNNLFALLF